MEKRDFKRIPARIEFNCNNIDYYGTITNLSANGMFIKSQKINFPLDSQLNVFIALQDDVLNLQVKIKRITKSNGYYDGLGVTLVNLPKKYLKLLIKLNRTSQSGVPPLL